MTKTRDEVIAAYKAEAQRAYDKRTETAKRVAECLYELRRAERDYAKCNRSYEAASVAYADFYDAQ